MALSASCYAHAEGESAQFQRAVLPVLREHCFACHSANTGKTKGGLALDTPEGLAKGGDSGAIVIVHKPDDSRLVQAIRYAHDDLKMPPKGRLPDAAIAAIEQWVKNGAVDPRPKQAKANWWSLQPIQKSAIPTTNDARAVNPIDHFIIAKLHERGLTLAPEADRRTLIRRLTFDLTGLPPTPEEIDAFVGDSRPAAYEQLVDRLLASPRYGERWARHWLDVVHYGDTHGYDKDKLRPNAWPYRDYVFRSFNADKPYGRFVAEQLAGDVLYPGTPDGIEALGFIAAGPWDFIGHEELPETKIDGKIARHLDRDDMAANTINTFLSLTVHCAQCHDHKFDPIPQADYYAIQAVFAALDRADKPYFRDAQLQARAEALRQRQAAARREQTQLIATIRTKAGADLEKLEQALAQANRAIGQNRRPEFGYHSALAKSADAAKWVQVDLGKPVAIERFELVGCHDDFNGIGPGFGFPVRFKIELSNDAEFKTGVQLVVDRTDQDWPNPGVAPQPFAVGGKLGRYVRVTASQLAWRRDVFIFALDELRVFDAEGKNVAQGSSVSALDSIEVRPRWGKANLVDGYAFGDQAAEKFQKISELETNRRALLERSTTDEDRQRRTNLDGELQTIERDMAALPKPDRVYAGTVHSGEGTFVGTGFNGGRPRPIHVLKRGDVTKPLDEVGPGAIAALGVGSPRFALPADASETERRAALARWIIDNDNPLTWRSIVNRVWQYHFGRGIVATPGDFGRMGEKPSHPELLDWLAVEFRDGGQSLKKLHRLMVTSATYRQAEAAKPQAAKMDAENRLLWRGQRRRLEAEEVRDALLFVAGKLDFTMGGPGFQDFALEKTEHSPHYEFHKHDPDDPKTHRRSIYRFLVRSKSQPFLAALDCADASLRVDRRNESLTPQQALALWNDRLAVAMAKHFAMRLEREEPEAGHRIARAFRLALGRLPTEAENTALQKHATDHGLASACRVIFNLNEFVFVD